MEKGPTSWGKSGDRIGFVTEILIPTWISDALPSVFGQW